MGGVVETLTEDQRNIILHALGADYPGKGVYRNYYTADDHRPELADLVAMGYMRSADARLFRVTEAGASAVGLYLPGTPQAEIARLKKALSNIAHWRERAWDYDDDTFGEGNRREFYGDDIADIEAFAAEALSE